MMAPVLIHLEIPILSSQYKPSILFKGQCNSWYWSPMIFMRLVNKLSSELRGPTVQFNCYAVNIEWKMNWWDVSLYAWPFFTVSQSSQVFCYGLQHLLCIKSGDVALPLNTPDDILWITVIGGCLFCGHLLNHSRHFINELYTTCSLVIASCFIFHLMCLYRNKFDPRKLDTRG